MEPVAKSTVTTISPPGLSKLQARLLPRVTGRQGRAHLWPRPGSPRALPAPAPSDRGRAPPQCEGRGQAWDPRGGFGSGQTSATFHTCNVLLLGADAFRG